MQHFGLSIWERRDYHRLLASHHSIDVQLTLMDVHHNELRNISARLLDGQVTYDARADVTRSLDLDLLDPFGSLSLDSDDPRDGALFADRMIRVRYSVIRPDGSKRYTCPVFTGPITGLDRSGVAVRVEAQGKESMGLEKAWRRKTYRKGWRVTGVIRSILRDVIGENKFRIPDRRPRIKRDVSVGANKTPWKVAKSLARSIGYQLYYDGWGVARIRRIPRSHSYTFRSGPGGTVKTIPQIGFSMDRVINAIEVWGRKPKKPRKGQPKKKRPHAKRVAPRNHPLSPWRLGGNGANGNRRPRFIPEVIEDDSIGGMKDARNKAKRWLRSGLLESVDVKFDALVVPDLEEMDVVRLDVDAGSTNFRLQEFALPLTASAQMSVGYARNVKVKKSAIRSHRSRARR